jgi:hypothetical protein
MAQTRYNNQGRVILNANTNRKTYENEPRSTGQYKNLSKRNFVLERNVLRKYGIKRGDTNRSIADKLKVSTRVVAEAVNKARARGADNRLRVGKVISVRTGQPKALRFYRKLKSKPNPRRGFVGGKERRVSIRCKELSRDEILKQIKRMTGQGPNAVAYTETKQLMAPPFGRRRAPHAIESEPVEKKLKDLGTKELCTWARKVATHMYKMKNNELFGYKKIKHYGSKAEIQTRNNIDANARARLQNKRRQERRKRLKQYVKQKDFKRTQDTKYIRHG